MTRRQHIKLMLILGALAALGPFAIDMYLPGFDDIARDFNTDIASIGLSLTSYFVGICLGQILCGPIVDRFGRRMPMMVGLVIFAVASFACALSPGLYWLVGSRFLLALGGCVGMVASRAIIRDLYHPDEIAKVFSTLMLIMGVAPILAPTAGSLVTATLGWRAIFGFLTLFALSLLIAVYRFLPESRKPDPTVSLSPSAVIMDYRIVLRNRDFLVYTLAGGLGMAALFSYITGAPLLFLDVLDMNGTHFAWLFGLNALGYIGAAQINQFILRYVTPHRVIMASGLAATTCGFALALASLYHVQSIALYSVLIFLFMASLGPLVPNTTALALRPFTRFAGSASALIGSIQMLLAALASAAVSTLANGSAIPMSMTMLACAGVGLTIVLRRDGTLPLPVESTTL